MIKIAGKNPFNFGGIALKHGVLLLAKSLDLDFLKVPGQQLKCDVYQQERLQHRHQRESLGPGRV